MVALGALRLVELRRRVVDERIAGVSSVVSSSVFLPHEEWAAMLTSSPWPGPGGVSLAIELTVAPWLPSAHCVSSNSVAGSSTSGSDAGVVGNGGRAGNRGVVVVVVVRVVDDLVAGDDVGTTVSAVPNVAAVSGRTEGRGAGGGDPTHPDQAGRHDGDHPERTRRSRGSNRGRRGGHGRGHCVDRGVLTCQLGGWWRRRGALR